MDHLETRGLGILNVKELKLLGETLYSMIAVLEETSIRERKLPSSAKKQQRIDFLRRGLFRDDPCKVVNDRLMRDMRSQTTTPSSTTTTASTPSVAARAPTSSATAATSTDNRKRPNHQISQPSQQQNRFSREDASAIFNAYYMSQFHAQRSLEAQYRPVQNHSQWPGMPIPSALHDFEAPFRMNGPFSNHGGMNEEQRGQFGNDSEDSAADGSSSSAASADPNSNPQNPAEAILLPQLLQMGFQKQEILDGIRQWQSTNSGIPTADNVMLHLVSQREEAEEARKEDEVRLRSEDQKQEESQRREQNQQESLSKANSGEELRAVFPDSWVLKVISPNTSNSKGNNRSVSTILCSDSRNDFIEFLKLEEKSRKWYGWVLPSEYFCKVGKQLKGIGDNESMPSWATLLCNEREKLRSGLYELKEQLKGQPKIFLDERPKENGCKNDIVIIDDDDD